MSRPVTSSPGAPESPGPGMGEPAGPSALRRAARSAFEWVVIIGGALLVAFLVKTFLVQAFYIPSASMLPTLAEQDRVLVNKLRDDVEALKRGDIIVFERPDCAGPDGGIKDLIKRVIALPGETIEGRDGSVYVDGERLHEPYLPPDATTHAFEPFTVPDDHVWVMGDNRGNSKDSRVLCNGPTPISEELLVGRAFVRVWPASRLSWL